MTQATPTPNPRSRKIGSETQPLKCLLTPHEKQRKHDDLVRALSDLMAQEREEAEVKAQLKRKRATIEATRGAIHQVLTAGYEYRPVEVESWADYDAGLVRDVRVDTGEEIDVRRMSDSERQTELNLGGNPGGNDPPPDADDEGTDPWGDPVPPSPNGAGPAGLLGAPADAQDAEFTEGDDEGEVSDDGGTAHPTQGKGEAPHVSIPAALVTWLQDAGAAVANAHLNDLDLQEVRDLYEHVFGVGKAGRAQKRTMIPLLVTHLFRGTEG